jgi:predicted  nucleic acid-binding Zn-ribbon protein
VPETCEGRCRMKELIQRLRKRADAAEAMRDTYPECDDDWEDLRRDLELAVDAQAYAEKRLSDLQGAYADANAEIERLRATMVQLSEEVAQANKDRAQAIGMANEAQAANLRNVRDAAFREQRLRAALEQYEIARSQRGGRDER